MQSSSTATAKNAGRAAAIVALVGFVLPWISCQGFAGRETASGLELAGHGAPGLWIIPVSMLIALGLLAVRSESNQERLTAAKVLVGTAAANLLVILYYYAQLNGGGQRDDFGLGSLVRQSVSIEFGAVLSFLGSLGLAISGFADLQSPNLSSKHGACEPLDDST